MRDFEATIRLCLHTCDKAFTISRPSAGTVMGSLSKFSQFHVKVDESTHSGRGSRKLWEHGDVVDRCGGR